MKKKYFICYKPYGILSQFTSPDFPQHTLSQLGLPKDVYVAGRLDKDSEGLIVLSNDGEFINTITTPHFEKIKEYLVQVEGEISSEAIIKLEKGVSISVNGKSYQTQKCRVKKIEAPSNFPERNPPIRFRKSIPTSFILIELSEGKNRQVRKMTAQVGFPTLRLIRIRIGKYRLENQLRPGEWKEISKSEIL